MLVVLRVKESPPFLWGIFILSRRYLPSDMFLRILFFSICVSLPILSKSQTLGGSATYNFLKLQQIPEAAALGGKNVSQLNAGLSFLAENPALLREKHHLQGAANFTFLSQGVTGLLGLVGYHERKSGTNFALGLSHLLYGEEIQTDAGGNILGNFRAYDQVVSISASREYGSRWNYGLTLKLVRSQYGSFSSTGIAGDAGITYNDTSRMLQIGFSVKNMGAQLKTYSGVGEDLPFDMLLGISKQLDKAPFRFSITGQRLNIFDVIYNDTAFNTENFGRPGLAGWGDKLISHFILGSELLLGEKVTISAGYNILRRKELSIRNVASGLTGFSYGLNLNLSNLQFHYARTHFQSGLSHHLVSVNYQLSRSGKDQK